MNKNIGLGILLGLGMVALPVEAQNVYELTAPKVEKIIYTLISATLLSSHDTTVFLRFS